MGGHPADEITFIITIAVLAREWSELLAEAVAQIFIGTLTLQLDASIMLPHGAALRAINFEFRRDPEVDCISPCGPSLDDILHAATIGLTWLGRALIRQALDAEAHRFAMAVPELVIVPPLLPFSSKLYR